MHWQHLWTKACTILTKNRDSRVNEKQTKCAKSGIVRRWVGVRVRGRPGYNSAAIVVIRGTKISLTRRTQVSRALIFMWMPLSERSTSRGMILGFLVGSSISWYLLRVEATTTFSSFMAKFWPMQFLQGWEYTHLWNKIQLELKKNHNLIHFINCSAETRAPASKPLDHSMLFSMYLSKCSIFEYTFTILCFCTWIRQKYSDTPTPIPLGQPDTSFFSFTKTRPNIDRAQTRTQNPRSLSVMNEFWLDLKLLPRAQLTT